jgi:hypothetical protein
MSHLSIDRLAALADEQPTTDETTHLTICAECAREMAAHRSLLALASVEREAMRLPLTRWDTLAPALRADGLLRTPAASQRGGFSFTPQRMLQVAAALLFVAGGALLGRVSAGAPIVPGDATPAVSSIFDSVPTAFASVQEAERFRNLYRDGYQRAANYLAQHDSARVVGTPAVMRTRLSALDRVTRITREALNDAPFDPVLNDFLLNSYYQREATLRELNTVLPQNVRLNSF